MINELFKSPGIAFNEHIQNDNNLNILFSGIYGIGKTTFLKWYFSSSEYSEKYNVIHLFPINYSILSNEDILTYIKYDILYELIVSDRVDLENDVILLMESLPIYLRHNFLHVFSTLLLLIPSLGKQYFQFYEELKKRKNEFEKLKSKAENNDENIFGFLEEFHKNERGLYENNAISKIIRRSINQNSDKESVLIIDDLDRIDPQHIFRIINVFAAHVDSKYEEDKNKFGFDKIILVCDITNVRRIFEYKYGQGVDFSGYIDKFYDTEIFHFDNSKILLSVISEVIDTIKFAGDNESYTDFLNKFFYHLKGYIARLFNELIKLGKINLRTILKYHNKELSLKLKKVYLDENWPRENYQLTIVLVMEVFLRHFGDEKKLLEAFALLEEKGNNYFKEYEILVGEALIVLGYDESKPDTITNDEVKQFIDYESETLILYKLGGEKMGRKYVFTVLEVNFYQINNSEIKKTVNLPNVYNLWKRVYYKLKSINYF